MKRLLIPILMILVLVQSFGRWIIVAEFEANQQWIAKNLCVNRNRPQLKCGGKCQLMKRLAAEEKAAAPGAGKVKFEETAWPDGSTWFRAIALERPSIQHHPHYVRNCTSPLLKAPFRPPGCVAHLS